VSIAYDDNKLFFRTTQQKFPINSRKLLDTWL